MEVILLGPEAQSRVIIFSLSTGKTLASQKKWMETIEINSGAARTYAGAFSSSTRQILKTERRL